MSNLADVFTKYKAVVFFDTETSGLDANTCQIIELAAIRIEQTARGTLRMADTADMFVKLPEGEKLPEQITNLTGITDELLGWCTPIDLFRECEAYARRKLALNKLHTGESYGEDYLALLTADTIRERAFSRYTVKRYELEAAL